MRHRVWGCVPHTGAGGPSLIDVSTISHHTARDTCVVARTRSGTTRKNPGGGVSAPCAADRIVQSFTPGWHQFCGGTVAGLTRGK